MTEISIIGFRTAMDSLNIVNYSFPAFVFVKHVRENFLAD